MSLRPTKRSAGSVRRPGEAVARLRDTLITLLCSALAWCLKPFLSRPDIPARPAGGPDHPRILVIKPCCLGDLLLATPAISSLHAAYPQAPIMLATSAWSRPAVEHNPHLTEILDSGEIGRNGVGGLATYWAFSRKLRSYQFDIAVVLDRSPLVSLLPFLAGVPIRAGLNSHGRGFSLTHPVSVPEDRHEAQLYLDVVSALGCQSRQPPTQFVTTEGDQAWAKEALKEDADWVAVHPGGGVNPGSTLLGKRWPPERYAAIVTRLLQEGFSVVLLGGAQDKMLAETILRAAGQGEAPKKHLLDLVGSTTFGQLGAVLQQCRLFVGNDTGPMHLAVAVDIPVVAVFGPSKPLLYGPFSQQAAVIYHGEECGNCRFRGALVEQCTRNYACMAAAPVEEVWAAVVHLLEHRLSESSVSRSLPPRRADASI